MKKLLTTSHHLRVSFTGFVEVKISTGESYNLLHCRSSCLEHYSCLIISSELFSCIHPHYTYHTSSSQFPNRQMFGRQWPPYQEKRGIQRKWQSQRHYEG